MNTSAFWSLIVALATGCANCSDAASDPNADPWQVGENGPDASLDSPDFDTAEDDGPVMQPDDLPTCVGARTSVFEAVSNDFVFAPVVIGDRVFVTSRDPDLSGALELREWTEDELIQHTMLGQEAGIVGFSEEFIWLGALESPLQRFGIATGILEEISVDFDFARLRWAFNYGPARQAAAGDRFAWSREDAVVLLDGRAPTVFRAESPQSPWVTDRAVVYEFPVDAGHAIRVHVGDREVTIGEQDRRNAWPVATDDRVFFVQNGDVHSTDLNGGDYQIVVTDGFCGPLHTDGRTVVTACDSSPPDSVGSRSDYLTLTADQIWSIDAGTLEARQIPNDGGVIYAPIVNHRWISWTEYDGDLGGQPSLDGRVMVFPRGARVATQVGRMSTGCPFCGAYWPPPRLLLGENTLAWNYALEEPNSEMFGPRDRYGVARLRDYE